MGVRTRLSSFVLQHWWLVGIYVNLGGWCVPVVPVNARSVWGSTVQPLDPLILFLFHPSCCLNSFFLEVVGRKWCKLKKTYYRALLDDRIGSSTQDQYSQIWKHGGSCWPFHESSHRILWVAIRCPELTTIGWWLTYHWLVSYTVNMNGYYMVNDC